jgi:hypothetical protein
MSVVVRISQNPFSNCARQQGASFETTRRNKDSHLHQAWHMPDNTGTQLVLAREKKNHSIEG